MLMCCGGKHLRDEGAQVLIDSLMTERSELFASIDADVVGYTAGRYSIILRAEVSGEKANPEEVRLFANNEEMEYSTAVGNYYERTSAYRLTLDEDSEVSDSLIFSLRYRDSVTYEILRVDVRPIMSFINSRALYKEWQVDRSKPISINWGGDLPDSISVCQMYTKTNENVVTIETDCIYQQKWNPSKSLEVSPQHYTRKDGGVVATFFVKWFKSGFYTRSDRRVGGTINIRAVAEQELVVDKSALM